MIKNYFNFHIVSLFCFKKFEDFKLKEKKKGKLKKLLWENPQPLRECPTRCVPVHTQARLAPAHAASAWVPYHLPSACESRVCVVQSR